MSVDARVGEHFGLADLGAADAGRAALDLPPGDRPATCGSWRAAAARRRRHRRAPGPGRCSAISARAIDQDLGGGKIGRASGNLVIGNW